MTDCRDQDHQQTASKKEIQCWWALARGGALGQGIRAETHCLLNMWPLPVHKLELFEVLRCNTFLFIFGHCNVCPSEALEALLCEGCDTKLPSPPNEIKLKYSSTVLMSKSIFFSFYVSELISDSDLVTCYITGKLWWVYIVMHLSQASLPYNIINGNNRTWNGLSSSVKTNDLNTKTTTASCNSTLPKLSHHSGNFIVWAMITCFLNKVL